MADVARFACPCGRPIQRDFVEGLISGGVFYGRPSVIVHYRCECSPELERIRRYWAAPLAVEEVVGDEGLPYHNPCPLIPVRDDNPDLRAWRYLLDKYGGDANAFITELQRA